MQPRVSLDRYDIPMSQQLMASLDGFPIDRIADFDRIVSELWINTSDSESCHSAEAANRQSYRPDCDFCNGTGRVAWPGRLSPKEAHSLWPWSHGLAPYVACHHRESRLGDSEGKLLEQIRRINHNYRWGA